MSFQNAFLGSLVADAISMPVHWYYDRNKLDRDYPGLSGYSRPKNPHPDSILWRSSYNSTEPKSDILHGQKKYWGQREIHYHQHLNAGENTLNLQLSAELYRQIILNGEFSIDHWLHRYAEVMLTPGWHNDTYIEEYHRAFFKITEKESHSVHAELKTFILVHSVYFPDCSRVLRLSSKQNLLF